MGAVGPDHEHADYFEPEDSSERIMRMSRHRTEPPVVEDGAITKAGAVVFCTLLGILLLVFAFALSGIIR